MKLIFNKQFLFLIIAILSTIVTLAQTDSDLSEKPTKKYNLTFRLDYGLSDLNFKNNFSYEGERLKDSGDEYFWHTFDSIIINNNDIERSSNIKFDLMFSIIEPLNIGLSYHFLNKRTETLIERVGEDPYFTTEFYPFFALAGMIDYKIAIKPVKRLYVNPSLTVGTYQGNKLFTGVGKEWYGDIKLAILYNIGNHLGVRVYADYSNWLYREKKESRPFPERNRIVKSDISSLNFGVGLSYRFFLVPD